MKRCPFCGEAIQITAAKCRYCSEWLDPGKRPPWSERQIYSDSTPDPRTYALPPTELAGPSLNHETTFQNPVSSRNDAKPPRDQYDYLDRTSHAHVPPNPQEIRRSESPGRVRKTTERFVPLGSKPGETHLGLPVHSDSQPPLSDPPTKHNASSHASSEQDIGQQDWVARRREQTQPFDTRQTRAIASGVWVSAPNAALSDKNASLSPSTPHSRESSETPTSDEAKYIPSSQGPVLEPPPPVHSSLSLPSKPLQEHKSPPTDTEIIGAQGSQTVRRSRRKLPEFSIRVRPPTSAFARLSSNRAGQRTKVIWGIAAAATALLLIAVFWATQTSVQNPLKTAEMVTSDSNFPPNRISNDVAVDRQDSMPVRDAKNSGSNEEKVRSAGLFNAEPLFDPENPAELTQENLIPTKETDDLHSADQNSTETKVQGIKPNKRSNSASPPRAAKSSSSKPGIPSLLNSSNTKTLPASKISQKTIDAQIAKARKSHLAGRPKRALSILNGLPDSPRTCEIRAEIESELGHLSKALSIAQRCVELNQGHAPCWAIIAALAEKNSDFSRTKDAWTRYLAISPQGKYSNLARRTIKRMKNK